MTALILYLIWFVSYIFFIILLNFILLILINNNVSELSIFKNNYLYKVLLILFYNENLSVVKLRNKNIDGILLLRKKNWPIIHSIHSKIELISKNKQNISTKKLKFKKLYNDYKFTKNNFNLNFVLNNSITNNIVAFAILNNIVNLNFNLIFKDKNINRLNYLLSLRFSILNNFIIVNKFNLNKFNDYVQYISNTSLNNDISENQLVIVDEFNKYSFSKVNLSNLKFYINKNLISKVKNNYFYLINNNLNLQSNTNFNTAFLNNLKKVYKISFSVSNIVKYLSDYSVNSSVILYLRKNKVFNKSRYSRNRQTYRTGAYWCLYINIIAVVAFYFWFYKFTMNFGYLWWLLYSFILSIFFSRAIKHKFYNPINIFNELMLSLKWLLIILNSIIAPVIKFILNIKRWLLLDFLTKSHLYNEALKKFKLVNEDSLFINQSFNWINRLNNLLLKIIY